MTEKQVSRRKFMATLAVLGGGIAVCGISGYLGTKFPKVTLDKPDCVDNGQKKVLVAFASKAGSTADIAQKIAMNLCSSGFDCDIKDVRNVESVSEYSGVVLGSAIYMNKVMSQASDFLKKFQKELSTIPYALFTVSLTMKEPSVENIDLVSSWIEPLKTVIQPEIIGYFAGVLDTESLPFVYRTIIRAMDEEDGDYRDWDAINTWAESLISIQ